MGICHASVDDVCRIIKHMKVTRATGIDGFLNGHFKSSLFNSSILISKLINKIIDTECWPTGLKKQILRPVYKSGAKNDMNNYRPIALLPAINKIIEKYFTEKIENFLEHYKILSQHQFGFRKNIGTNSALKDINDLITGAINEGKYVGAVLIDLQKAFDTINHAILYKKCSRVGIRGKMLNIIKSYMEGRAVGTKIDHVVSTLEQVRYGVPQGSTLGPLLFLIYINDIAEGTMQTKVFLYADDIILVSIHKNYNTMIKNLQQDFNHINSWLISNELFISEKKTQFISISMPQMKPTADADILYSDHL